MPGTQKQPSPTAPSFRMKGVREELGYSVRHTPWRKKRVKQRGNAANVGSLHLPESVYS